MTTAERIERFQEQIVALQNQANIDMAEQNATLRGANDALRTAIGFIGILRAESETMIAALRAIIISYDAKGLRWQVGLDAAIDDARLAILEIEKEAP